MSIAEDLEVRKEQYKVLGTRPIRHDGADKVTGRAIYGNDFQMAGLVYGKILRSPHAHARILSIATAEAEAMEGVVAVVTAADMDPHENQIVELGEATINLGHLTKNVLAREKVLYKGHALAAVAATNPHVAEQALGKIEVEYEILPPVTDVIDAMKPDAPLLHEELHTDEMGKMSEKPSNISRHIHFEKGDLEKGFAEAEVIVEREFRTASVHQGYIEPQVATALWNNDGHLKIWSSTQGSFTARQQTAELLGLPISAVTVQPMEIGGGFGGKIRVYLEPVASLLSKKCGRPVKVAMERADVFQGTGPTPGSFVRIKLGATKAGKLVAGEAWLAYEAGGFPTGFVGPGSMCVFSCYDLPAARVDGYDVCVNKPQSAAYRAPGSTPAAFGCESVIDELSEKLGIDPLKFRLRNASREGTRRVDGPVYPRIGLVETIGVAMEHEHYAAPLTPAISREGGESKCGRGVACGFWFNAGLKSSASASVNPDGTVMLVEGSTDIGGTRTSVAMQLAETLGIAAEDVHPKVVDTDSVGYTDVTGGSRVTFCTGWAAYEVGLDIRRQMSERAAQLWECPREEVIFEDGVFRANGQSLTFCELAGKIHETGGPIVARASVNPQGVGGSFATHIVDVEVDLGTGKVTILRYTAIQDCGKAIHPSYVEGQIQGGVVQGIGWALNEEYMYDEQGRMLNPTYLDYRMPTSVDVPMIEPVIVEVPNPGHPYGVRGVGEVPIVPPPPAIAAAIHRAIGVRMNELPMSPPKIWKKLGNQEL